MRHDRRVRALLLLLIATGGVGTAGCGRAGDPAVAAAPVADTRLDVAAHRVIAGDLETSLELSGSLVPQTRVAVMSRLPGTLATVRVDVGEPVRAGQVLAELDARELDAQVDAAAAAVDVARAALEAADAALASAQLEHDRTATLFEGGAVPRQRVDAADTALRSATAQRALAAASLAQAEASHRRSREVRSDATITAPADGVVVERNYDAGSLVGPGDRPVFVVADLTTLRLQAGVSELEAGRLRVGMPARITVQARPGDTFEGQVTTIAPEVDARNRHFAVEVRTRNRDGALLSGMYGVARIPLERADAALAVPLAAVLARRDGQVVLRLHDGAVQDVPVTLGLTDGTRVQILTGLTAGDIIVADARVDIPGGASVNPVF